MPNNDYANEPNQSRSEDIISSILDGEQYDEPARSRIEYLLIQLKYAIEGGGGGGGVTSYSPLTEKPKIDNHTLQAGNNSSSDLGLQTKLTFDSTPTENSTNPVTSGGVYTALSAKANSTDVYNKSTVDAALTAKADKSTTYTKTEVDTALSSKQNTISDLADIRSGAAAGATAIQPVSGKGLSTNDYTTAEKEKLAGIEAQANKTTVDSSLSDSSTNPVQNKVVKSALDGKQATLTTAQLAAVNSGITSTDVDRIETNKNNISLQQDTVAQGGNGYAIINGIRLYISSTTPTGSIPQESTWINGNIIKAYGRTDNLFDMDSPNITDNTYINTSGQIISDNSYELSDYIPVSPSTAYTWRFNLDSGSGHTASSVGLYNGDKELISGVSHAASARYFSFTTDANTAYVRCSVYKATADEAMLNLGNSPLPYVPYLDWQ